MWSIWSKSSHTSDLYVESKVLATVLAHSRQLAGHSPPLEALGLLLGSICLDDGGFYTYVVTSITGELDAQPTLAQPTDEGMSQLIRGFHEKRTGNLCCICGGPLENGKCLRCDFDHSELQVVGTYHSHPNFGCWLSDIDKDSHRRNFTTDSPKKWLAGDYHVSLVVDSIRREQKFFAFRNNRWPEIRPVVL